MPAFLWLRFLTIQRLALVHRKHLGVQGRDAGREVGSPAPGRPSADVAAQYCSAREFHSRACGGSIR